MEILFCIQQWYEQSFKRLFTWLTSRTNFKRHQLKVSIVFL